jgi:hypothetical protein
MRKIVWVLISCIVLLFIDLQFVKSIFDIARSRGLNLVPILHILREITFLSQSLFFCSENIKEPFFLDGKTLA